MKRTQLLLIALVLSAILPSCETTDDPRAGGLFGYMATGDAGYQRRLMERQNHLNYVEDQNAAEARKHQQLQGRKSSLLSQKQKLSQLRSEAMGMTGGVSLAGRIHQTEQNAENTANLEAKVRELESQVSALRRRQ